MIGILAGMGPKSTGPFIDKVVEECQKIYGAKNDIDFPQMMIHSCPTPFYIDRPIDHEKMEFAIIEGSKRLERAEASFIAIPCNTAHIYFEEIKKSITLPLLNMVEETIKRVPGDTNKITVLATKPTMDSGVFQKALEKENYDYVYKKGWQESVNKIILGTKHGEVEELKDFCTSFFSEIENEVDTVIIACTDLNVVTDRLSSNISFVDTSTCLAQAVVHKYVAGKK